MVCARNDLAAHVYDITYGSLEPYKDNLVIIDDSIVRGTTLRESIFKILDRLHPKKIVMVSSSPQIRYPDYYGIDMSHLEELCAFRAAIALIQERGMQQLIAETYRKCKTAPTAANHVRTIYEAFSVDEINRKIVAMRSTVRLWRCCVLRGCRHPSNWCIRASRACTRRVPITQATGTSRGIIPHRAASGSVTRPL